MRKLAVVAFITVLFGGCALFQPFVNSSSPEQSMINLMPSETRMAAFFDVEKFGQNTFIRQAFEKQLAETAGYREFIETSELNLFEDVTSVSMAISGDINGGTKNMKGVFFLALSETGVPLYNRYISSDLKVEPAEHRGIPYFKFKSGENDYSMTFLEEFLVVLGDPESFLAVLDNYRKGHPGYRDSDVLKYILKNRTKETAFWGGVYTDETIWEQAAESLATFGDLTSIRTIAFYWNFLDAVTNHIQFSIQSGDPDFNKRIVGMLNGFLALAKMGSTDNQTKELFDSLNFSEEKDGMRMEFTITESLLELFKNLSPEDIAPMGLENLI